MSISKINTISTSRYGVNAIDLDPTAALWLCEAILNETGKNVYSTVRSARDRAGKGTVFPSYGSEIFASIKRDVFAK